MAAAPTTAPIPMVSCGGGPYRCLLQARQVVGMAGGAADAIPIEHWLGLPDPASAAGRRLLSLVTPDRHLILSVADPVYLIDVPPETLFPLPPLIQAGTRLHALRALHHRDGQWQLVLRLE